MTQKVSFLVKLFHFFWFFELDFRIFGILIFWSFLGSQNWKIEKLEKFLVIIWITHEMQQLYQTLGQVSDLGQISKVFTILLKQKILKSRFREIH